MVLMAARCVMGRKKETCFDRSVGTLHMVALDNILYNKNNITRKQLHPFLYDKLTIQ